MTNATVSDIAKAREISEMVRELGSVSRALASNCLTVELALERRDWESVHEAAEVVLALGVRFAELRRGLLVQGVRRVGN